jgi:hypothetical protein
MTEKYLFVCRDDIVDVTGFSLKESGRTCCIALPPQSDLAHSENILRVD